MAQPEEVARAEIDRLARELEGFGSRASPSEYEPVLIRILQLRALYPAATPRAALQSARRMIRRLKRRSDVATKTLRELRAHGRKAPPQMPLMLAEKGR